MPQLLKSLPNPFSNPFGSRSSSSSSTHHSHPMQIRNQFYKGLREFTAWQPWGQPTGHNSSNDLYIEIKNHYVKRCDYPAELQKLIDFGWRTASAPKGARATGFNIGGARASAGAAEPGNHLRRGFGNGKAIASNWDHVTKFEQVGAYAFRGDTRPPEQIMTAGGFQPPSQRSDDFYRTTIAEQFYEYMTRKEGLALSDGDKANFVEQVKRFMTLQGADSKLFSEYHFWRTVLDNQQMHIASMTVNSFLKAYISTTRDAQKAADASQGTLGGVGVQQVSYGWIYLLKIKSGFLLKKGIGGVGQTEGEIAHLGPVAWKHVFGFMHRLDRQIYLRNYFDQEDYPAFQLALRSFSNIDPWLKQ
jgi:hypothetical protein